MDFMAIFQAVSPVLISLLSNTSTALKSSVAPPVPEPGTVFGVSAPVADQAIKDLQAGLNAAALMNFLTISPPLVVDGWLGPLTDAAIEQAITKLKGIGL